MNVRSNGWNWYTATSTDVDHGTYICKQMCKSNEALKLCLLYQIYWKKFCFNVIYISLKAPYIPVIIIARKLHSDDWYDYYRGTVDYQAPFIRLIRVAG